MAADRLRLVATPILVAILLVLPTTAATKPVVYHCDDKTELAIDFTPRLAQVRSGEQHWTLLRARDSGLARYANHQAGVSLTAKKREVSLQLGQRELRCKFEVMRSAAH